MEKLYFDIITWSESSKIEFYFKQIFIGEIDINHMDKGYKNTLSSLIVDFTNFNSFLFIYYFDLTLFCIPNYFNRCSVRAGFRLKKSNRILAVRYSWTWHFQCIFLWVNYLHRNLHDQNFILLLEEMKIIPTDTYIVLAP